VLLNGFLRNSYASAACVIANSFFISSVGADQWPQLNFWVQSLTIAIFISFIYAHDKRSYEIYALVLLLIIMCSLGLYMWPESTFLVYGLGTFIITSDLLGNMVNQNILAGIFSRPVLRELDQSVIPAELAGRVVGAGFIEVASRSGQSEHFHFLLWFLVVLHLFCFVGIIRYWAKNPHLDEECGELSDPSHVSLTRVVSYAMTSTIVQFSLLLMIWNQCVKFLTQALYFQAANHLREGLKDTSQFLSHVNFLSIAGTYLFQLAIGRKLVNEKSMAYLFRVMPMGFVMTGVVAMFYSSYWIIVFQYIFFVVINKVINAPMTRQYLFMVPKQLRGKSYIFITVVTSFFLILTSGVSAALEDRLGIYQLMVSLVIVSVLILVKLARFEEEQDQF
jgi:hypothetical protein